MCVFLSYAFFYFLHVPVFPFPVFSFSVSSVSSASLCVSSLAVVFRRFLFLSFVPLVFPVFSVSPVFVGPFLFGEWPSRDFDTLLVVQRRPHNDWEND